MEPKPEFLQGWNPYALIVLISTIAGLIGAGVSWFSGRGMQVYNEWASVRLKLQAERRKQRFEEEEQEKRRLESKRLIERIIEGNNTVEGYKQLLLVWDDRLRMLEDDNRKKTEELAELQIALTDCMSKHAIESAAVAELRTELKNRDARYTDLEGRYEGLRRRLMEVRPTDPWPSPPSQNLGGSDAGQQ